MGKNVVALFFSQTVTWILSTILVSTLPRFLGPTSIGQLRIGGSVWTMVTVLAGFGTASLVPIEVARRPRTAAALKRQVIRLRLVVVALLIPFVVAYVVAIGFDRQLAELSALLGVSAIIGIVAGASGVVLHGLQEMGVISRTDIICELVLVSLTIIVVVLGGGAYGVVYVSIVVSLLGLLMLRRALGNRLTGEQAPAHYTGRGLLRASVVFLWAEASLVIYQQIDTVVMSALVDSETIGWYGTADVLFGSLLFVPVIVTTSLFPAIAHLHHRAPEEVAGLLQRTFRLLLLISVPVGLGTIIVSKDFVLLLYGQDFAGAIPVLRVFGVVTILSSITILLGRFALATERARYWSLLVVVAILASIALDLVLVPWTDQQYGNGAIGGGLSYVVTESMMVIAGVIGIAPRLLDRVTRTRIVKCVLAGAAMLAVGWPLRNMFFVVSGAASVMAYVVVLVVLSTLDPWEREQVGSVVRRVTARIRRS